MMKKMSDFFDETGKKYYEYLLKQKDFASIIELYKSSHPNSTSVKCSFLGILSRNEFKQYCEKNNIDLIETKEGYIIRFDNDEFINNYYEGLIKNLKKDIQYLETKRLPKMKEELKKYEAKLKCQN